jgi:hypothetical protein
MHLSPAGQEKVSFASFVLLILYLNLITFIYTDEVFHSILFPLFIAFARDNVPPVSLQQGVGRIHVLFFSNTKAGFQKLPLLS